MKNKASLLSKIYRKIHWTIYKSTNYSKYLSYLYSSYRHRNYKALSDNCDNIYMTQRPNDGAGIGHQIANYNNGLRWSQYFGLKHAYYHFADENWDKFLGFGQGEESVEELKKRGWKVKTLPYFSEDEKDLELIRMIIKSYGGQKIILNINLDQFYQQQYGVMSYIKNKFENAIARKADKVIYESEHINIAVHIRRGDIVEGQKTGNVQLTQRWLDIDYYEEIVRKTVEAIKGTSNDLNIKVDLLRKKEGPVDIYIFSQDQDDYSNFNRYGNVIACNDMSAIDSFLHMVRADILVTSKSSFSYKPALIADGIRICPGNFWHDYPSDDHWIVVE